MADSPEDAAFLALHAERQAVERDLVLVRQRRLYGQDSEDVAKAERDEPALLTRLDRILTQLRAAEYKRQPGARRW
ncbi:MAG: hypothetical protein K2Y56_11090 [Methylobacterium sp.]|uniref:hypothetical protein n=1 Tax=Methylobacterium sp. TaxID=409 RepID=UPI0025EAC975|nr:hypothetical protein [Methylobacterium sp.]MBX9932067.1 hypothetical protein [Methylobacterium sp.]